MKPIIHLCLVSAQATPNLTPALDPAIRPRRVILLVSPDMRRRADWLERPFRSGAPALDPSRGLAQRAVTTARRFLP